MGSVRRCYPWMRQLGEHVPVQRNHVAALMMGGPYMDGYAYHCRDGGVDFYLGSWSDEPQLFRHYWLDAQAPEDFMRASNYRFIGLAGQVD